MKKVIYIMALMNSDKTRTLMMIDDGYKVKETLKANGYTYDGDRQMWYKVTEETAMNEYENLGALINNDSTVLEYARVKGSPCETACRTLKAEIFG